MTTSNAWIRSVELDMIRNDAIFYFDLVRQAPSIKSAGILIFGLLPYLSLFNVETRKYLSSQTPDFAQTSKRQHEKNLQTSRTMVKLFDDDLRGIPEIENAIDLMVQFHVTWFVESHRGILAWLKKLIQPDLGLYLYNKHIIATTHVATFNLGFVQGDRITDGQNAISSISDYISRAIGYDLGEYLSILFNHLNLNPHAITDKIFEYDEEENLIEYTDKKAKKFYASIFNGPPSLQLNFCLSLFLVTVNFLHYAFRNLVIGTPDTFFKLKFITLYHLIASMKRLQNYYRPKELLSERSKNYFGEILSDKELRRVLSRSDFRNILVHYSIRDIPDDKLNLTTKFYGLVEYYFEGKSFQELNDLLDKQIERVSQILEIWWKHD